MEMKVSGPVIGSIRPPGSKSITNRAMICAAAASGASTLSGVLDSDDTRVMIEGLRKAGVSIDHDAAAATAVVHGLGGDFPATDADIFIENSGTTVRFLTALLTAAEGRFRLDGVPRMRERPIGDLIDALRQLGGDVASEAANGCPPVLIHSGGLKGGSAQVRGAISSQFLSGLLMAAPLAKSPVQLAIEGELVSRPYVDMTLAVMRSFGVNVAAPNPNEPFVIEAPGTYQATDYSIEPDASAASYFWGAAAITGGEVTVEGLTFSALQGDVGFCRALEQMGCKVTELENAITVSAPANGGKLRGIHIDMNAISDTVQTLAAVAMYADGPTTIVGVAHNRHKETDRIGDLACELRKLGAEVEELADGLKIIPQQARSADVETYHDHRMAMSLALVGLRTPGVRILNPECTAKTYPHFFNDLEKLVGAKLS